MISYEDQDDTDNPDACAMPAATLALAAAVGGVLGLVLVGGPVAAWRHLHG